MPDRPARSEPAGDRVFVLLILAALATIGLLFGALFFWSNRVDAISQAREAQLVQNGIDSQLRALEDSVTSVTQWDDAVAHMDNRLDRPWIDTNIAVYLNQSLNIGVAFVIGSNDEAVYAMRNGHRTADGAMAEFVAASRPLIALVRKQEALRGPLKPSIDGSRVISTPIRFNAAKILDGAPYMLSATLVQSDFGKALPKGPRSVILLTAARFDSLPFTQLRQHYLLDRPLLLIGAHKAALGEAEAFLRGPDHDAVATVVWSPQRPGRDLLNAALPAVTLAAAALGLALLVLTAKLRANLRSLRRTMAALVVARDAANVANEMKSQFLANMSHEIRTPLNGVMGVAQVMMLGKLIAGQREQLDLIHRSGEALLVILGDLLDFSMLETRQLVLETAPFDLGELAAETEAALSAKAIAKGLSFEMSLDESALGGWCGDQHRVRQIIEHLAANAIKFTPEGGVRIVIAAQITSGVKGLEIQVSDTGVGIAPDKLSEIFQKFSQADGSHTRRFGGVGLGLAISGKLAKLMNGSIEAESIQGRGSTFIARLPLEWLGLEIVDRVAA